MNQYRSHTVMSKITSNKTALLALAVLGAALASFALVPTFAAQKAFAGGSGDDYCGCDNHDDHHYGGHDDHHDDHHDDYDHHHYKHHHKHHHHKSHHDYYDDEEDNCGCDY